MGVKNHIRLALLFICIMMVGIALYPYVPRIVKIAQAVQGELKFGAAMEQEMRIVNKTFYSADMYFGNGSGGTIGVLQGTGNVGIGMGVSSTNMRTPQQRLSVADTMAITAPSGIQYLLMGNQDAGGAGNPAIIRSANGNLEFGKGTAWIGPGGTFTSNVFFGNNGNVGLGSTNPGKKLDVVGDINFSGNIYQGGVAFRSSRWSDATGGIYYNSGNVGIGTTAPRATLDVGDIYVGNFGTNLDYLALQAATGVFPSGSTAQWAIPIMYRSMRNPNDGSGQFPWNQYGELVIQGTSYGDSYNRGISFVTSPADATGPSVRMRVTKEGNVGIGTTNPQKKLDIAATNSTINNTSGNLNIVPSVNLLITQGNVGIGTTNPLFKLDINGIVNATALYVGGAPYLGSQWTTSGTTIYYNTGNVGIGSATPVAKLDIGGSTSTIANVSGNISIVPAGNLVVSQGNVGIGSATPGFKLDVNGIVNATALYVGGSPYIGSQWTTSASNIYFNTGNVGIGVANPAQKLDVDGALHVGPAAPSSINATGGTITTVGGYRIHTFTSSGTFTPGNAGNVEVLVVAGGGGGAGSASSGSGPRGGGGAGGVIYNASNAVTAQAYTVTVGAGGTGGTGGSESNGTPGQNSVFNSLTAIGGGYGASYTGTNIGGNGGSGGGGSYIGTRSSGTSGQGYAGGIGTSGAGGGGGAGGQGRDSTNTNDGGYGGPGLANSISGLLSYYGGGGGAGAYPAGSSNFGLGGIGGGGRGGGGAPSGSAVAGTPNTGGGGGGGGSSSGGANGGSGIVIIRYPVSNSGLNIDSSGNIGVGTTTPSNKLDIEGSQYISGNVGIGTTAPAQKLDVVGTSLLDVTRRTTLFPGSVLINAQQSDTLNHWIGNPYQTWTLCFRKSVNGTSSAAWHAACDNKGQTVTIANLNTGQLMGGYAECSFTSRGGYYHGCGAGNFLFNLTKGHVYRFGGQILGDNNYAWYYGIYDASGYGPTFGGGHDWYVADGLNSGYCNLGYSYPCRKGTYSSDACRTDLCGSYNSWTITDLETWYVNN